jgi:hypothetical protein
MLISSRNGKGWVFPKVGLRQRMPDGAGRAGAGGGGACCERRAARTLRQLWPDTARMPRGRLHPRCFPQGGWENDETVEAAAMRETVEEAGVRGRLEVRFGAAKLHPAPQRPAGAQCGCTSRAEAAAAAAAAAAQTRLHVPFGGKLLRRTRPGLSSLANTSL